MFLSSSSSTDEGSPNNPSASSNFLHLTNSSDELGQSLHSSFSIRDYACNHRTKNIQKSWPFFSTSLQLCLKHGLSDPLPPMQPLNSVVSHPPEALSSKKPHIAHVESRGCKRKFEKLGSNHALAETKQGIENGSLVSGSKSKINVANVDMNPSKKRGFVVKPGACVDSESKEDQGCLFSASESMALRTCPICKTFLSASNTTSNVHVDKFLSVDSGEQPISKRSKPRGKPRMKVKTMVDIYAAAKGCTLEDLDQRNGTKWAVISSHSNEVVSDKNKPEVCNKRKNQSVVDENAGGIGPVYIDAKGQKLRIISEFKEKASDPSREHEEDVSEKKSSKEGRGNSISSRKRLRGKKYNKHCKGNASEILEYQRGYSEECRVMERSGPTKRRIKRHLGRNICDQPSENGDSSSADPLVSRVPSHAGADVSETVSSHLNSQNSWRSCGESQVFGKITKRERCSMPVDKVFASEWKGVMKLKKEEDDEDSGRWESEMTQERVLTDWDGNEEIEKVFLNSNTSTTGGEDKHNNAEAEFENMVYERTGCATTEQGGSTFMEVDPIPIPGPPGSFLQSPWDMETDAAEHHGNFSVITSQVQYSQDQLDLTDRNSSESAISCFAAPVTQKFSLHNINNIVPAAPSNSNLVLRLMGKDLMVINQIEDNSQVDSSLKPTSLSQDLSKTQHVSPPVHLLHRPYGGNGLYLDTSTSLYNIP